MIMNYFCNRIAAYIMLAGIFIIVPLNRALSQEDANHHHKNVEHSSHEEAVSLSLNDSKKWQMDDHTRKITKEMLVTFTTSDHSTVVGLNSLGRQLRVQLDNLIKGCTMTGQAHEQLHIFLNSYIPAVDSLTVSNNFNSAVGDAIAIKNLLDSYQIYFE